MCSGTFMQYSEDKDQRRIRVSVLFVKYIRWSEDIGLELQQVQIRLQ